MDAATHFLVPYAGAVAALGLWRRGAPADRARAGLALVFGVSGFAPDTDSLLDFVSERFDAFYYLQHRGLSHALVGAPLYSLVVAGVLAGGARVFPRRLELFQWRPAFVPAAVLGAWTHLLLDAITYGGIPLLWPFAFGRFGFPLFSWIVVSLFPVGVVVIGLHLWGKVGLVGVARAGAILVAALVVVASVRGAAYPWDAPDGTLVFPRASPFEWTLVEPLPNGTWVAYLLRDGGVSEHTYFAPAVPGGAGAAVELARSSFAYRGFLMGSFSPIVTRAEPDGDGGWRVRFTDVAQRFEAMHEPRWTPVDPYEDWGWVEFVVDRGGELRVTHRGY